MASGQTASSTQVGVMKKMMDQQEQQVAQLLEGMSQTQPALKSPDGIRGVSLDIMA
jgi:hypothetical protein